MTGSEKETGSFLLMNCAKPSVTCPGALKQRGSRRERGEKSATRLMPAGPARTHAIILVQPVVVLDGNHDAGAVQLLRVLDHEPQAWQFIRGPRGVQRVLLGG